jgi:hypothetical protein
MFRFAFFVLTIVTFFVYVYGQNHLIWTRIPKFYVDESVIQFINSNRIVDCFSKLENENRLLLKCWRNNKLVDVEINIEEKRKTPKMFYESISI